ncbi:MAG: 50S ribosomal protein L6 [Bacteroidales bacterium]|jgi:large subunit ribosomal protein L6
MSRIGKLPISIPKGVEIKVSEDNLVTVKGSKGELNQQVAPEIKINIENGVMHIERSNDDKTQRSLHGLYRSLIANMVKGVSEGFTTQLELVGVGYKATTTGQLLELSLGYSHNIFLLLPEEIKANAVTERGKNPIITLESHDKQLLGQVVAKIRSFRKPEPYKGKGVKFVGEEIKRKAGKSATDK